MNKKQMAERKKQSTAGTWAKNQGSGFTSTTVQLPMGLSFFEMKPGEFRIAVLGYEVGKGNPNAKPGDYHFVRSYQIYKNVGPAKKWLVALATLNRKDPIQEWRDRESRDPDGDGVLVKLLAPKKRELYLIYDFGDGKTKVWDAAANLFGEELAKRIRSNKGDKAGWNLFYFPDEDGFDLEIEIEPSEKGKWNEVTSIDFVERDEPLPDSVSDHGYCLDDMVVVPTYDELHTAFHGLDSDGDDDDDDDDGGGRQSNGSQVVPPHDNSDVKKSTDDPPAVEKTKALPTADECGIEKGDVVSYNDSKCVVKKISPDGTSLTLLDVSTDDVYRGVGADECVLPSLGKAEDKKPESEPEPEEKPEKEKTKKAKPKKETEDEWAF